MKPSVDNQTPRSPNDTTNKETNWVHPVIFFVYRAFICVFQW